jgi:cytochrome P450
MPTLTPSPPRPEAFLRNLRAMHRDPLQFLTGLASLDKPVVPCRVGPERVFLIKEPRDIEGVLVTHDRRFMKGRALQRAKQLLGEGLLTSEGELHRRQRRLCQPAFHREGVARYARVMVEEAERVRDGWRDGETRDIAADMATLALAIVGRTLFGADVTGRTADVQEALTASVDMFNLITSPLAPLLERLPTPRMRRFHRAQRTLDEIIFTIIAARRASGEDRGDLLSMLLLAQDEDDASRMSDRQVRDEALTLFLAGHETTANALAWTWYLLSRAPDVEARLHAEIDAVLGERPPAMKDVPRLTYTRMVLAESMRLFPPAWIVGRRALVDHEASGVTIPAGSIVIVSQYITHRDPRFYPDPERFDPERWTAEASRLRPKFAYFPFGGGSRICIGEAFAWTEATLVLAVLARRWRLRLAPDARVAPLPLITLRPRHGMPMRLSRRGGSGAS